MIKRYFIFILVVFLFVSLTACKDDSHKHSYVEGKCTCGEVDPNYEPPHTHEFVEGKCTCGEVDPNYEPPHTHEFIEGKCTCGEIDPNYEPPHTHEFIEGKCTCGEVDPKYKTIEKTYVGESEHRNEISFNLDKTCEIIFSSVLQIEIIYKGTYDFYDNEIKTVFVDDNGNVVFEVKFNEIDNCLNKVEEKFYNEYDLSYTWKIEDKYVEKDFAKIYYGYVPLYFDSDIYTSLGFVDDRLLITSQEQFTNYFETLNIDIKFFSQENLLNTDTTDDEVITSIDFERYDLLVYKTSYTSSYSIRNLKVVAVLGNVNIYGGVWPIVSDDYVMNPFSIYKGQIAFYCLVEKNNYVASDIVDNLEERTLVIPSLPEDGYEVIYCKPVIYLYPEEEMELIIKFLNEDNLLTTYPKYNNEWNVIVKEDGTIYDKSGRSYYALFFDEKNTNSCEFNEGFYVTKDNAIEFLEEKLDILGFTEREANEFIMFWLPILEQNEQSIVYFEQTLERNENCPLYFSTTPDSMLRVTIHIKKVDGYVDINEQQLYSFERNGFCVVEWGGVSYN
ncbi:MAG: hypothetical protein E7183_00725 [Erysipelotrichaceae bacterium]|nr:hypothetical protein [Erysipelotrichaceae bacterium]